MNSLSNKLLMKDIQAFYYFNSQLKTEMMNRFMLLITHLGGATITILIGISLILIKPCFNPLIGWELILVLTSSHLFVHIIKRIINRERPYVSLSNIDLLIEPFESYSFPSGHTTASFSVALVLSFYLPFFSPIFILIALLVGISRVYLGVHYPSDILIGIFISTLFFLLIHYGVF
ncbi:MAG: phosphatase PAP2 family protein [bacterium]